LLPQAYVCAYVLTAREVRIIEEDKPYYLTHVRFSFFIRGPAEITEFNRLVDRSQPDDLWARSRNAPTLQAEM